MEAEKKLLVGVDEAGFGPNLGPLVVVAALAEVPDEVESSELWDRLSAAVSRWPARDDDAIVVDDSKRVYSSDRGVADLERTVLAWLGLCGQVPKSLREIWKHHCLTPPEDMDEGPWLAGRDLDLPRAVNREILERDGNKLAAALAQARIGSPSLVCQIIMPRRYNELVDRDGSKSVALFHVAAQILRHLWDNLQVHRIDAVFDKHGGRNFYRGLLQQEFHETLVMRGREGPSLSQYQVGVAGRELRVTFVPKADGDHFLVALASMMAKYLRELCMDLINSYWTLRVPGLKPTAGYPVDARRFWLAIEETARVSDIPPELIWRQR